MSDNKTVPRGLIEGDRVYPGPIYDLPPLVGNIKADPRSTCPKYPAWKIGTTAKPKAWDDASPGPVYLSDPDFTRTGKSGVPHFSLYSRYKELEPSSKSYPGPGAYQPKIDSTTTYKSAPQPGMGIKPTPRDLQTRPAPNAHTLDPMIGKVVRSTKHRAPKYTIYPRIEKGNFAEDLHKTPGPAAYAVHEMDSTKKKAPNYSFRPRPEQPSFIKSTDSRIGPGSHRHEQVTLHMKATPRFSFGKKHSKHVLPAFMDVFE